MLKSKLGVNSFFLFNRVYTKGLIYARQSLFHYLSWASLNYIFFYYLVSLSCAGRPWTHTIDHRGLKFAIFLFSKNYRPSTRTGLKIIFYTKIVYYIVNYDNSGGMTYCSLYWQVHIKKEIAGMHNCGEFCMRVSSTGNHSRTQLSGKCNSTCSCGGVVLPL